MKTLMMAALMAGLFLPAQLVAQIGLNDTASHFVPLAVNRDTPPAARVRVSVGFDNAKLEDAVREVARQAGLGLSYRPGLPGLDRRVTLIAHDTDVASVMVKLLAGSRIDAAMKPNGTTILLRERKVIVPHAGADTTLPAPETIIPLAEVVVTPGQFGIAHESPSKAQTLSREQIETLPQLGEDLYRTVNRLPGIASNEMSAKLTVRGGSDESLLVLLDGIELFEPYHLKDFDGSLSIIDVAAIRGVDFSTGGFTADYGNRLTGVFDMRTTSRIPTRPHTSIGLSVSNARFMSEGAFGNGKGLWLISARRGYLDILLHLIGETNNLDPRYYDALGKIVYQLSDKHRVSLHALRAGDTGRFVDDDYVGQIDSNYGSTYGWLVWDALLPAGLNVSTKLYTSALDWQRAASEHDECCNDYDVRDTRGFTAYGIKQDWQAGGERVLLKWGGELRTGDADYSYYRRKAYFVVQDGVLVRPVDSVDVAFDRSGTSAGFYVAPRVRPWSRLTVEAGLRWDRQSYVPETEWSPRINAAIALPLQTTLRAAWGRYAQPQQLFQIPVQDGETTVHQAERAEQLVLGVEKQFSNYITARIEAYRRREWSLRPRYYNLSNAIEAVGEVGTDRARIEPDSGRAHGVELFVQRTASRTSWSLSYALARAYDVVGGVRLNRPLEQRHTIYADYSYAPSPRWRLSTAWVYHSGWPITTADFRALDLNNGDVFFERYFLQPFGARLQSYQRLDVRATRTFTLKRGELSVFIDVFNALNRDNPQRFEYSVDYNGTTRRVFVNRSIETLLPRLPSLGATWEF